MLLITQDGKENKGQDANIWGQFWNGLTPESEIRMWDFYGLRHWILKYVPRNGKVIEAGCGLGRYVFYLSKLGINIEGIDFHGPTIEYLNNWQKVNDQVAIFSQGDVKKLSYPDNILSGYISLGVLEHFIEGPDEALKEAYRALRPGGIMIISTPARSFAFYWQRFFIENIKSSIKKVIRNNYSDKPFFQYWYSRKQFTQYVKKAGFEIVKSSGADLLYSFSELCNHSGKNIRTNSFATIIANNLENTIFANFGAQSITIAIKVNDTMHCFLCGKYAANQKSLHMFDVPICENCKSMEISKYYRKNKRPYLQLPYNINPEITRPTEENCEFCGRSYITDLLFEDFGYSKKVCQNCLKDININIKLSVKFVKARWRNRLF